MTMVLELLFVCKDIVVKSNILWEVSLFWNTPPTP
jgi:hypothetical protein